MKTVKRYEDWKGNITDFLEVGDIVDDDMYYHFLCVMPPVTHRSDILQVGEPYNHIGGRATFLTFVKIEGNWVYKGDCFRGEYERLN